MQHNLRLHLNYDRIGTVQLLALYIRIAGHHANHIQDVLHFYYRLPGGKSPYSLSTHVYIHIRLSYSHDTHSSSPIDGCKAKRQRRTTANCKSKSPSCPLPACRYTCACISEPRPRTWSEFPGNVTMQCRTLCGAVCSAAAQTCDAAVRQTQKVQPMGDAYCCNRWPVTRGYGRLTGEQFQMGQATG